MPRLTTGNGLAVLANKCAANVFDISSGMVHASIRDQIVRAQLLVRDLAANDPHCQRLLIVGAGIAGVAAAVAASHLGKSVLLVETRDIPFHLQAQVSTRYVGPFMYEWPSPVHASQDYPLMSLVMQPMGGTPKWTSSKPIRSDVLAAKLTAWLKSKPFGNPKPDFWFSANPKHIKSYVRLFSMRAAHNSIRKAHGRNLRPTRPLESSTAYLDLDGNAVPPASFIPDYVVLAAGMGNERIELSAGVSGLTFWEDDSLRDASVETMRTGIFGGGDGALQDVLRILTKFEHPLDFIAHLQQDAGANAALAAQLPILEALEQQSRLVGTWSAGNVYELIDRKCAHIARNLSKNPFVLAKVHDGLKPGSGCVHHFVRETFFGKAYLLNRFCVHLIRHCRAKRYHLHRATKVSTASKIGATYHVDVVDRGKQVAHVLDLIVVRSGLHEESMPGRQMIRLDSRVTSDRVSLAGIPLPYVV